MTLPVVLLAVLAQWPTYPGAPATDVDLSDPTREVRFEHASYFVTPATVAEVAAFFAAGWEAQRLQTSFDGDFLQEGIVAAFDLTTGEQRSVILFRLDDGRTLAFRVVAGLAEFERLLRAMTDGPYVAPTVGPAPLVSEGGVAATTRTGDDPGGNREYEEAAR